MKNKRHIVVRGEKGKRKGEREKGGSGGKTLDRGLFSIRPLNLGKSMSETGEKGGEDGTIRFDGRGMTKDDKVCPDGLLSQILILEGNSPVGNIKEDGRKGGTTKVSGEGRMLGGEVSEGEEGTTLKVEKTRLRRVYGEGEDGLEGLDTIKLDKGLEERRGVLKEAGEAVEGLGLDGHIHITLQDGNHIVEATVSRKILLDLWMILHSGTTDPGHALPNPGIRGGEQVQEGFPEVEGF